MATYNNLLQEYFLQMESLLKAENANNNEIINKFSELTPLITKKEYWKLFISLDFDGAQLQVALNAKSHEERCMYFKFAIACFVKFVQCNFTGPELEEDIENFFDDEMFQFTDFGVLLSVNKEEINPNTKCPGLFMAAKLIFVWCHLYEIVNFWWVLRSLIIHQYILEDLSPSLLSEADNLYKLLNNYQLTDHVKAALDIELAQLFLSFRQVGKAKIHLKSASEKLGISYNLIGKLGKRTKHQEKDIAQLSIEVTVQENIDDGSNENNAASSDVPENLPLNDDVRLDSIVFADNSDCKVAISNNQQKLFLTIVQEMIIARPTENEELQPFIDLIVSQKNTFTVRVVALLIRSKLEGKSRRTIERSLLQNEELIKSFKRENPHFLYRVVDVFGSGMIPIWKVESYYAETMLNIGLVKNSLDIFLKLQLYEDVIVCYTLMKMRHKAAEVIKKQLEEKQTVKLWCLLGDATDDVDCYETAWEFSKRRSHRAQRHWGQFLYDRKQYEECIPHFEKSVSINPLQSNVWFRLGFAALQLENWQTAATAFRRFTTLEPDGFEAWNNLAQAYIKIGNKRNAHQAILEALKCNYENWKVWANLLVISCDISNYSDVIRAYHRLLDLKEKYLDIEVLNALVYNVVNDNPDIEGKPSSKYLKKTRELFGRITSVHSNEAYVWELYSTLAPTQLLRLQRLQRAYRGYTQSGWDKNVGVCQQVLSLCQKMGDIALLDEIEAKDPCLSSIRLNISSAVTAVKKQDWEETKESATEVALLLEEVTEKLKSALNQS